MRILIIEDETPLREQVVAQLREQGYAVDAAADGRTGLYLGQEYPLDAAIVDLGLPDMRGHQGDPALADSRPPVPNSDSDCPGPLAGQG